MRTCLGQGRLLYLGRGSLLPRSLAVSRCTYWKVHTFRQHRRWWSRPFSTHAGRVVEFRSPPDPGWLRERLRSRFPNSPVHPRSEEGKDPNAWIPSLEKYLPESSRATSVIDQLDEEEVYKQGWAISTILSQARYFNDIDLLVHLGFELDRWPAVHALLGKLIDSVQEIQRVAVPLQLPSSLDWGASVGISLDQLSGGGTSEEGKQWSTYIKRMTPSNVSRPGGSSSLHSLSYEPYADEASRLLMANVWFSLGSIVLEAADRPGEESKLAMSYVFQVLARLHHSGLVSENVYKYAHGDDSEQLAYRPPGMYLLSTYIMSVLSDAAWRVHEAEAAAKAAAAGQTSPFLPLKIGFRELGPEVWLELILWCCVDHGYYTEGARLLESMRKREGDLAWNWKSWESLLEHPESVEKTDVGSEEVWRHVDSPIPNRSQQRKNRAGVFHGLAKRTVSVEVVVSILNGLMDNAYLGLGVRGLSPSNIRRYITLFSSYLFSSGDNDGNGGKLQPTTRAFNWLVARNLESAGLNLEVDPQALERLLRTSPHIVPPWDESAPTSADDLAWLPKSQLYDGTSALAGLVEYSIKSYAHKRQSGAALKTFTWLQEIVDSSKLQHIHLFLERVSSQRGGGDKDLEFFDSRYFFAPQRVLDESSIPQMSNITFALLLDVATTAKAFKFEEWLLHSGDVDGPAIRPSAYGDQALAPSLFRFAAATRDGQLCDAVVESLESPVSVNTMRALMNAKVALGEWDRVVRILEYMRDHRLKSWGHSNMAALAAAVLDAEAAIFQQRNNNTETTEKENNKKAAITILIRIFNGEFNDKYSAQTTKPEEEEEEEKGRKFQQRVLHSFRNLFMTIPGALQDEVAKSPKIKTPPKRSISPYKVPIIPTTAIHPILSSLVNTYGSMAGKKLWERWCVEVPLPGSKRLHEGGIPRLYLHDDDMKYFDNMKWFEIMNMREKKKAVIPDLDTVRIIAQKAMKEYRGERVYEWEFEQDVLWKSLSSSSQHSPPPPPPPPSTTSTSSPSPFKASSSSSQTQKSEAKEVLEFCIRRFQRLGLPKDEMIWELKGCLD